MRCSQEGHRSAPGAELATAEWVMSRGKPFRAKQSLSFTSVQHQACFGFVSWFLGAALMFLRDLQVSKM